MNGFTIGDAAEVLGISASKLRFWESKGILSFDRDNTNNYRKFTFQTLIDATDVFFAREIGMPIGELQQFHHLDVDNLSKSLNSYEQQAEEQIEQLEARIALIHSRKRLVRMWNSLVSQGIKEEYCTLLPIYAFSIEDRECVSLYMEDPSSAVDLIPCDNSKEYQYGRFMKESKWELLRPGDAQETLYLVGPLWMDHDRNTNIDTFIQKAHVLGYEPGRAISQFLFSCYEHEADSYSYLFKAWLEITPRSTAHKAIQ